MKVELYKALKIFMLTIAVAFLATNQENFIYSFIEKIGFQSEVLKKTTLSATITLVISIIAIILSRLSLKIKPAFQKIDVVLNTKLDGSKRTTMSFEPDNCEYSGQDVEIDISLKPGGKISNILMKKIGISLKVYFNPELLDVSFPEKWETNTYETFNISKREIIINLFEGIKIEGEKFGDKPYKLNEKITVKPIRIKNDETTLDFVIVSSRFHGVINFIVKHFININLDPLKVMCKGE